MKSLIKTTLPFISLLLLVACGKSDESKLSKYQELNQNEQIMPDGSNVEGLYAAELWPINFNLNFSKVGSIGISRKDDNFTASVKLQHGPRGIRHVQAIYTGRRCPNLSDDKNKDAFIDMSEALAAIGDISIPLDGDLSSQSAGSGDYPTGHINTGKYFYQQTTSFEKLFSDLKSPDVDPEDLYAKLEEGLTLPGRIVLIQGATEKGTIPDTIATVPGKTVRESLPIACGVIWKVRSLPSDLKEEVTQ